MSRLVERVMARLVESDSEKTFDLVMFWPVPPEYIANIVMTKGTQPEGSGISREANGQVVLRLVDD